MNRRFRPIWRGFLSLLLLIGALALTSCEGGDLTPPTQRSDITSPDETSKEVSILEYTGDHIEYELYASKVDRWYEKRLLKAIDVRIKSVDPKTMMPTYLSADSTIVDDTRNMIFAYGKVVLSSPSGKVYGDSMVWDRNTDEILVPGKVTLEKDGNILRGESLRTNPAVDFAYMDIVSADGKFDEADFNW
jgi:LPS export ABC transporter protein LptC